MTKRYDVYGVGNALVDIEIETTSAQLDALGVEKGLMTLVDPDRQRHLMASLDGLHHHRTGGGSAANTIMAAALLGADCFYSCKVADDDNGTFFTDDMRAAGVETNLGDRRESGTTGTCLVMVTEDADRTMNTSLGISETLSTAQLVPDELARADYLYVEGYLVSSPNALETALEARRLARHHDVKVAFTFSDPAMVQYCRDGLDRMLEEDVHLLFCNDREAMAFTGEDTPEAAGDALRERVDVLALTLGPRGSRIWDGEAWVTAPGLPVHAVDTNGAGDLYAGAFLYGITHGLDCRESARLASLCAGVLVTRYGARLDGEALRAIREMVVG